VTRGIQRATSQKPAPKRLIRQKSNPADGLTAAVSGDLATSQPLDAGEVHRLAAACSHHRRPVFAQPTNQ
jgi:hypothetical protein